MLVNDDKIRFAKSTRTYSIEMDYTECREYNTPNEIFKINKIRPKENTLDRVQSASVG